MTSGRSERSHSSQVSSLLHTLRGEAFRHQRNLQGDRARAPSSVTHGPSLPPMFTSEFDIEDHARDTQHTAALPGVKFAGPSPPRSWVPALQPVEPPSSPEWRARALSLIFHHAPSRSPALASFTDTRIPSLFQMCLYSLFAWGGIPQDIFPALPRHVLREYVRYSVVYVPELPKEDLEALWAVDVAGSADGELIVTGPSAGSVLSRTSASSTVASDEWDSAPNHADPDPPPVLHTLIVLSSPVSASLLSLFPPTLTHLALLRVPYISLHKLPTQLPLITVLDLSFNPWIGANASKTVRVEWHKWTKLDVLGMRECGMGEGDARTLREKVNRGRLTDVLYFF